MTPSAPPPHTTSLEAPWRQRAWGALLALLALGGTLALAEAALPLVGQGVWAPYKALIRLPAMSRSHDALGWENLPGVYRFDPTGLGGEEITVTLGPDGARGEAMALCEGEEVWALGGSFTQGFAVGDGEDFPSVAGAMTQGVCIYNYGVPGYGTVQSMGLYSQLRDEGREAPDIVVYGLVEYHDARNIGALSWLAALDRARGTQAWVQAPFARFVEGEPAVYPPMGYHHWPMSERWALVHLVERAYIALSDWTTEDKTRLTLALIDAWSAQLAKDDVDLMVALLYAPEAGETYLEHLRGAGVSTLDLRDLAFPGEAFEVPGDGHPNARAHRVWGEALGGALRDIERRIND